MKRFGRWIFGALAALSLLSCLFFFLLTIQGHPFLLAFRDHLWFYVPYWDLFPRPPDIFNGWPIVGQLNVKGIGLYFVHVSDGAHDHWNVWLKAWPVALLSAALPGVWVYRFLRRHVYAKRAGQMGFCAVCGYDLRATPDRCPECGTIPPKKELISN